MTKIGKGRRLVGAQRVAIAAELAGRYRSGMTIRALVAETGRSYGSVHRLLRDSGEPFRGRGGTRGRRRGIRDAEGDDAPQ
jgi:hypothetical protein